MLFPIRALAPDPNPAPPSLKCLFFSHIVRRPVSFSFLLFPTSFLPFLSLAARTYSDINLPQASCTRSALIFFSSFVIVEFLSYFFLLETCFVKFPFFLPTVSPFSAIFTPYVFLFFSRVVSHLPYLRNGIDRILPAVTFFFFKAFFWPYRFQLWLTMPPAPPPLRVVHFPILLFLPAPLYET